jgi:hypothetical protein
MKWYATLSDRLGNNAPGTRLRASCPLSSCERPSDLPSQSSWRSLLLIEEERGSMRYILPVTVFCLFSAGAAAECVRWKPPLPSSSASPDLDGPGSFGALQDTVTLDCLKYVGSIQKNGVEHVRIKDERGKVHVLRRGGYVGENHGFISRIDSEIIYINQLIQRNGEWEEVIVKFRKRPQSK